MKQSRVTVLRAVIVLSRRYLCKDKSKLATESITDRHYKRYSAPCIYIMD